MQIETSQLIDRLKKQQEQTVDTYEILRLQDQILVLEEAENIMVSQFPERFKND